MITKRVAVRRATHVKCECLPFRVKLVNEWLPEDGMNELVNTNGIQALSVTVWCAEKER